MNRSNLNLQPWTKFKSLGSRVDSLRDFHRVQGYTPLGGTTAYFHVYSILADSAVPGTNVEQKLQEAFDFFGGILQNTSILKYGSTPLGGKFDPGGPLKAAQDGRFVQAQLYHDVIHYQTRFKDETIAKSHEATKL